jgi:UDP-N-acetylmuramyl pentapeptide phosphotransferase/UDP-N-acetylglucosamine-1-phosphate transferase
MTVFIAAFVGFNGFLWYNSYPASFYGWYGLIIAVLAIAVRKNY